MAEAATPESNDRTLSPSRSKRRILIELTISYGLILLVIWTPRPWQKHLWWIAAAAVFILAAMSFKGFKPMGLRVANFFQSIWIVGVALLLAAGAIVVAIHLDTLRLPPSGTRAFIKTYWAYALWACVQQLLLQGFFLPRFLGLSKNHGYVALLAATLFALAHLPNPILTPVTFLWGLAACLLFMRYRNLFPLALAHAIFGIAIAITIPGPIDHNMRVGYGYLIYHPTSHPPVPSLKP
jgi:membrane protease YdiL (CAAX protease family)